MIRRYIPKRTNLADITQAKLDWIADLINKKPRKILGYRGAYELAMKGGIF